jgi:hypothetical protein
LIFKLRLHPKANLDEDTLLRFGLSLVARDEDRTLVVFSSDEDLAEFRRRVDCYGSPQGPKYGEVGGIEGLDPLTPADRTGPRLRREPVLEEDGDIPIDVELWHPGTIAGARNRLAELRSIVEQAGGRFTDDLASGDLAIARCHADATLVFSLLELDIVREVDRMPEVAFARLQAVRAEFADLPTFQSASPDSTGILILDSGITARHPMIEPALGDAQVFPNDLGVRDGYGPADADQRMKGHGTAVAGFATWGRPGEVVAAQGPVQPQVNLFSARVLDEQAHYDPDLLVEHQLEEAVRYFLDAYPTCRVINLSLGDDRLIYRDGGRQTRLAARIDELAYQLQARNVLFTVSTGNYAFNPEGDDYPAVLLEPRAALIEPATAALALTVGGVSSGGGPFRRQNWVGQRAVAGEDGYPSPFTRAGFGVGGMIKPEFVEAAGDLGQNPRVLAVDDNDPGLGLPTTNRDFAPPEGRLMRAVTGTSFAAPAIAHAAALVFNRYPEATPNLVRALLADSAALPAKRPAPINGLPHDERVLRVYGYGRPNAERAIASAENDVLLLAESTIAPDAFQLFEIPFLPDDFLRCDGSRSIAVTLAFDPPTRRSRGDSYLGVSMQFHLFRNTTRDVIAAAFRDWRAAPPGDAEQQLEQTLSDMPARQCIAFLPGAQLRSKGTLQRGVATIRNRRWLYEGGPLILAVSCLRKWAPIELNAQRYAVVVSLRHSNPEAILHSPLRARLTPRVRTRVR